VVHLFERDCSLQRRHQKVIEEAPAPGMPEDVRAAMGDAAVEAARAIGYRGAGTVEFIADGSRGLRADGFWFMEMNTRLQVEHPVSEAITGLDFVELQLRIAAGAHLPFKQDDLAIDGWAFEARLYAEDVPKGFLPATGTLDHLAFPEGSAFEQAPVRIDSGVRAGDVISPFYDPMIAKVIVHGRNRDAALNQLRNTLAETGISGLVTNLDFLSALTRHEGFARGDVDTGLITRDLDGLISQPPAPVDVTALAGLLALGLLDAPDTTDPWSVLRGWRPWGEAEQMVTLRLGDDLLKRCIGLLGDNRFRITEGDVEVKLDVAKIGDDVYALTTSGHRRIARAVRLDRRVSVFHDGRSYHFEQPDPLRSTQDQGADGDAVLAPMPGLVRVILAEAGQEVQKGDPLIVLEAMKMEHTLSAPRDGVIAEISTAESAQVDAGAILLAMGGIDDNQG
jgi:3-methylcrotonyl-CoA carboxylase alpha subunit